MERREEIQTCDCMLTPVFGKTQTQAVKMDANVLICTEV